MIKSNKNLLSKKQLASIGYKSQEQVFKQYWNPNINNCFKPYANEQTKFNREYNQSYKQFSEMDLSGPNENGTGRYRFCQIQKIQIVLIAKKIFNDDSGQNEETKNGKKFKNKKDRMKTKRQSKIQNKIQKQVSKKDHEKFKIKINQNMSIITRIMTQFFQIPVQYNCSLKLSINQDNMNIRDQDKLIQYEVKHNKQGNFDVWSLIDLGLQIKEDLRKLNDPNQKINEKIEQKMRTAKQNFNKDSNSQKPQSILLFLIQANLLENGYQIDGRATGDGVAFITFRKQDFQPSDIENSDQQICYTLPIIIHQCLHTLGFDHCSAWQCLMNSITNNQFMLCPACVRKIESELRYKIELRDWYARFLNILTQIRKEQAYNYGQNKCLKILKNVVLTSNKIKYYKSQASSIKQLSYNYSMIQKCVFIIKNI